MFDTREAPQKSLIANGVHQGMPMSLPRGVSPGDARAACMAGPLAESPQICVACAQGTNKTLARAGPSSTVSYAKT